MKKEFLKDYQRELISEQHTFIENSKLGQFSLCSDYYLNRFHKPSFPISALHSSIQMKQIDSNLPIWNFIPLSRTLVVSIAPASSKAVFEKYHGFKIDEIPDIVEYVRNTGKLQFVLRSPPLNYEHMDFLEPIFVHLKPPMRFTFQPEIYFDSNEVKKYLVEFYELAKIIYIPYLKKWSLNEVGSTYAIKEMLQSNSVHYAYLKGLGYNQLVDEIQAALISNVERFHMLLMLSNLLIRPLDDPLQMIHILDAEFGEKQSRFLGTNNLSTSTHIRLKFPGEIGRFLFKRLIHATPTLESCKQLTYLYGEEDLYKVGHALNQAIKANKPEIIKEKSEEISTILENIWKNENVTKRIKGTRIGIPILFAALGAVSHELVGFGAGLLTSLGFDIADELFKFKDEAISEKIGKAFSSSYETILYDFKKKYPRTAS